MWLHEGDYVRSDPPDDSNRQERCVQGQIKVREQYQVRRQGDLSVGAVPGNRLPRHALPKYRLRLNCRADCTKSAQSAPRRLDLRLTPGTQDWHSYEKSGLRTDHSAAG